jgi:hypothetical protein
MGCGGSEALLDQTLSGCAGCSGYGVPRGLQSETGIGTKKEDEVREQEGAGQYCRHMGRPGARDTV